MAESLEGTNSQPPSVTQPFTSEVADLRILTNYIKRVVSGLLEDNDEIHPALLTALADENNCEVLKKFIGDPQCGAILIQRSSIKDEEVEGRGEGDEEKEIITYIISDNVHFTNPKVNSIVILKTSSVIEAHKKIMSQVCVMNFNDASPYETPHSYTSSAVAPYFESYVRETGRAERSNPADSDVPKNDEDEERERNFLSSDSDVLENDDEDERQRNLLSLCKMYSKSKKSSDFSSHHKCLWCSFATPVREAMIKHMKERHNESEKVKCPFCYCKPIFSEYINHVNSHLAGPPYLCRKCPYFTTFDKHFISHMMCHAKTLLKKFNCEKCSFATNIRLEFSEHKDVHPPEPQKIELRKRKQKEVNVN